MIEGKAFSITTDGVDPGSFYVMRVLKEPTGTEISGDTLEPLFFADGSLAGDLFGPVVFNNERQKGNHVAIASNPIDEITFESEDDE